MRHGKAERGSGSGIRDHDLPFTRGGEQEARSVAHILIEAGCIPNIILTSSAHRAVKTAEFLANSLGLHDKVHSLPILYEGTADHYLHTIQQLPAAITTVLIIGHNPSVSVLAQSLRGHGISPSHFTTGAIACIEMDVHSWTEVSFHLGTCRWFYQPEHGLPPTL